MHASSIDMISTTSGLVKKIIIGKFIKMAHLMSLKSMFSVRTKSGKTPQVEANCPLRILYVLFRSHEKCMRDETLLIYLAHYDERPDCESQSKLLKNKALNR